MSAGLRSSEAPGLVDTPVFMIPVTVWQKMFAYIQVCPIEVNGFGYVQRTGPSEFELEDVFILDQVATAGSVDVTALTLGNHMEEMRKEGRSMGSLRMQWHSHVNMAAYFSGTDTDNIEQFGATSDWMLSLVANKRYEFEARLDIYKPFRVWSPLEVQIITPLDKDVRDFAAAEVRAKVREPGAFWDKRVKTSDVRKDVTVNATTAKEGTHHEG